MLIEPSVRNRHRATYWAVTDDWGGPEGHAGYERTTAMLNDRLGAEDGKAWRGQAPNRSHPSVEDDQ